MRRRDMEAWRERGRGKARERIRHGVREEREN